MNRPFLKADVMKAASRGMPEVPPPTERELQLRDYLVTYGQCRAAGMSIAEAEHNAAVTRRGMSLVRAHDAAVLNLKS